MNWLKDLTGKIKFNRPLSAHTTFRIGGPAQVFFQPKDINDLRLLLINAKKDNIRVLVIGAGSNLLVDDKGVRGIVVKLTASAFQNVVYSQGALRAGAGLLLSNLVKSALEHSLGGCEFLAGIPGTVGGALIMNAGITQKGKGQRLKVRAISDIVSAVTVMDYSGNVKVLKKKDIRFAYRSSSLYNYIVLDARLRLRKKNKKEIKAKLKKLLASRRQCQDYSYPNAGCVFKNPQGHSGGRLIDLCGLKGKCFGDACISYRHANFILNKGKARAKDVLRLIAFVRRKVKSKFGVTLEPEIKIWQN